MKLSTKRLIAVPAFALGAMAMTAAPAMAVPADEVQQILEEVDVIVVVADVDTSTYENGSEVDKVLAGDPILADSYSDGMLVDAHGYSYNAEDFSHASASVYEGFNLEVPDFIAQGGGGTDVDESNNEGSGDDTVTSEEDGDVIVDEDTTIEVDEDEDVTLEIEERDDEDADEESVSFEERDDAEGEPTEITAGFVPGGDSGNPAGMIAALSAGALALGGGGYLLTQRRNTAAKTADVDNS